MTLRSQTVAIVVLLVAVGAVFVLVGAGGVNTAAHSAASTPVPPTTIPTSTPLPEGSADAWMEVSPGEWSYTADPNLNILLNDTAMGLPEMAQALGVEAPAEDADFPAWDLLENTKALIQEQIAGTPTESTLQLDGPTMKVYQNVAVAFLYLIAQEEGTPSTKTIVGMFEESSGNMHLVQAQFPLENNAQLNADFEAWLDQLVGKLAVTPEATEEAPATTEEAATPAATEEAAAVPAATEEAAAPAATEEVVVPVTTEEAAVVEPLGEGWVLTNENYVYVADPSIDAQMSYEITTLDNYIANSMLQAPADAAAAPFEDLLSQIRTQIEAQITQMALALEEGQFVGPLTEDFGSVSTTYIRFQISPQTMSDSTPFEGTDQIYALVDGGDGRLISLRFSTAGEPSEAAFEAFKSFIATNADVFTTPDAAIIASQDWLAAGGQALYGPRPADPISLVYNLSSIDDFMNQLAMQAPAEDSETPLVDLLNQLRTQFESFGGESMVFDGPTQETLNDIPVAFMHVTRAAQEATETTVAVDAMDVALVLFYRGEGEIAFVQYVAQGEPDQAVYEAFHTWVEDHVTELATATVPLPKPQPEATAEPAPAATESAD